MKLYSRKNIDAIVFCIASLVIFIALNTFFTLVLAGVYFDTTSDKRYSLSEETLNFLEKNDKKFVIRFYVSKDLNSKNNRVGSYAEYLRKLFENYKNKSNGKIEFTMVEVTPFTSTQAEAENAGIVEFKDEKGENYMYLGAAFTNDEGETRAIPYFPLERKNEVEADISRILSVVAQNKEPVIGIISPFFRVADEKNPLRYAKNFPFVKQLLNKGYKVVSLNATTPYIPENIDTLLLFYPINTSENVIYAMDQYLMRGGSIIIVLDAFSEARFNDEGSLERYNSGLNEFLDNMGIKYSESVLVGDNKNAREFELDRQKIVYPLWPVISVSKDKNSIIARGLNNLYFNYSGYFDYVSVENLKTEVLLETSNDSGVIDFAALQNLTYDKLLKNYRLTGENYPLALLVEGKVNSIFDEPLADNTGDFSKKYQFLSVPLKNAKILLVADSDMVMESLWNLRTSSNYDVHGGVSISDNMLFLLRAVDYMSNSGYLALQRKVNTLKQISLADILYEKSLAEYEEQRQKIEDKLTDIKQKKVVLEEEIALQPLPTAKNIKYVEELKRDEANKVRELEKLEFMVKEKYQNYLSEFRLVLILILPIAFVLFVWGIYFVYNRNLMNKAREFIDE